jgi:hypothetical protein
MRKTGSFASKSAPTVTPDAPVTSHDAGMHADSTYKYETTYEEEVIATDDFAANDEEFVAATLAVYIEENVAVDTLAAYDEETTAVEGEPWGA